MLRKIVDIVSDAYFSSDPAFAIYRGLTEEYKHLNIQLGTMVFRGHTIDPAFTESQMIFTGKIRIMHDSNWGMPMVMRELAMAQLIFEFLGQDDCQEVLSVYVDKRIIDDILKEV
ncbi:MAG: hypothetical protein WCI36_03180 [bacterium]